MSGREREDLGAAVQGALRMMLDNRLFSLSARQVTVSTVGVIPNIARLGREFPRVSFALSLHAPTQALRERIVPSAKAYKLDRLLHAVRDYIAVTGQRVFVEYVLLVRVAVRRPGNSTRAVNNQRG